MKDQFLAYIKNLQDTITSKLEEVDYPVIWICTSEHAPSNIGETIYIN